MEDDPDKRRSAKERRREREASRRGGRSALVRPAESNKFGHEFTKIYERQGCLRRSLIIFWVLAHLPAMQATFWTMLEAFDKLTMSDGWNGTQSGAIACRSKS